MSKIEIRKTIKIVSTTLAMIISYIPSSIAQTKIEQKADDRPDLTLANTTQPSQEAIPTSLQAEAADVSSTDWPVAALQSLVRKSRP